MKFFLIDSMLKYKYSFKFLDQPEHSSDSDVFPT